MSFRDFGNRWKKAAALAEEHIDLDKMLLLSRRRSRTTGSERSIWTPVQGVMTI